MTKNVFPIGTSRLHEPLGIIAANPVADFHIFAPRMGYFHSPRQIMSLVRVLAGERDLTFAEAQYFFRQDGMPWNPFDGSLFSQDALPQAIARLRDIWAQTDICTLEISTDRLFLFGDLGVQGNPNSKKNVSYAEVWKEGYYAKYEPESGVTLTDFSNADMLDQMRALSAMIAPKRVVLLPHFSNGNQKTEKREDIRKTLAQVDAPNAVFFDTRPFAETNGFRTNPDGTIDIHHLEWAGVEAEAAALKDTILRLCQA